MFALAAPSTDAISDERLRITIASRAERASAPPDLYLPYRNDVSYLLLMLFIYCTVVVTSGPGDPSHSHTHASCGRRNVNMWSPCKKNLPQERCLRARLMSAARNKIYAYERRHQNRLGTRSRMSRGSFSGSSEPKRSLDTRQASTLASMKPTWRSAAAVSSHTPAVVIFV